MPDNLYIVPQSETFADAMSHTRRDCTIKRVDCTPTPTETILHDGEFWNCNLCQTDSPYFLPWVEDMKFMVQTLFSDNVNPDPENPVDGWGTVVKAELYDASDDSLVSGTITDFASRYLVGWDGTQTYQLIEIDTSKAAFDDLTCFYVKLSELDSEAATVRSLSTQVFSRLAACSEAVKVEGRYNTYDCFGFYYGAPVAYVGTGIFAYSNALYFEAEIVPGADNFTKTAFSGRVVAAEVVRADTLALTRALPPWAKTTLIRQILAAPKVYVNSEYYELENFTPENKLSGTRMFLFDVPLEQVCEVSFRCVPFQDEASDPLDVQPPGVSPCCVDCIGP